MKTGFKVMDGMTNKPITATKDSTLDQVAHLMKKHDVGSVLINEEKKIKGIVTEQDLVRKAITNHLKPGTKISEIMETKLITIRPEKDIYDAIVKMKDNDIRHLPVIDDKKKLVGLITMKDVLKIEPQLFELIVEMIELKEEHRKPLGEKIEKEGICHICGQYSNKIERVERTLVCPGCRKHI